MKNQKTCKNIQIVSPSVWVWRENRIKPIKKYVDLTACLFKFEDDFYKKKDLPSVHLGHPFSKLFPKNKESVIKEYNLNPSKKYVSILPGSRASEIKNLLPTYIEFIKLHSNKYPDYEYLIPASDQKSFNMIKENISKNLPIKLNKNCATDFLSISDFSVVTSGTATLESAVLGARPIICYKTNPINYFIISRMLKIDDVGLPNLLLEKREFPELIQKSCNPQSILKAAESMKVNIYTDNISNKLRDLLQGLSPEESAQEILSL
jgi:lipid-A-disaccharide synthase